MRKTAALALAAALGASAPCQAAAPYGILLLAHGGDPAWNQQVLALGRASDRTVPTEVAFGMADPEALAQALKRLESRGPAKVVAVPLFINSSSEVLEQTRYALGLKEKPSETMRRAAEAMRAHAEGGGAGHHAHHHMFSLERSLSSLPLVMTPALDAHPLVAEILLERAKALSRDPAAETVVLVGHGPVDDKAVRPWEKTMSELARRIKKEGGFQAARIAMLRDDAPPAVRAAAVARLREAVAASASSGRVLVVPCLVSRGGIENKITAALEGLTYEWDAKTLMPHPNIALWLAQAAAQGVKNSDMRLKEKRP